MKTIAVPVKHPTYGSLRKLVNEIDKQMQAGYWPRIGQMGALYWFADRIDAAPPQPEPTDHLADPDSRERARNALRAITNAGSIGQAKRIAMQALGEDAATQDHTVSFRTADLPHKKPSTIIGGHPDDRSGFLPLNVAAKGSAEGAQTVNGSARDADAGSSNAIQNPSFAAPDYHICYSVAEDRSHCVTCGRELLDPAVSAAPRFEDELLKPQTVLKAAAPRFQDTVRVVRAALGTNNAAGQVDPVKAISTVQPASQSDRPVPAAPSTLPPDDEISDSWLRKYYKDARQCTIELGNDLIGMTKKAAIYHLKIYELERHLKAQAEWGVNQFDRAEKAVAAVAEKDREIAELRRGIKLCQVVIERRDAELTELKARAKP